jgi:hypothetical protein
MYLLTQGQIRFSSDFAHETSPSLDCLLVEAINGLDGGEKEP